ncbi:exported hypothetical protein [Nostocoides japonicum T1-X7]|uniref:Polysaccharide chain length determinant N-terminal domain-containing protein n=1 Tax=Nostocoides japonicum T1-X7 TaxID=1194083 RepID=A0A077M1T6_9MICO|nr:Wzz/FepE/Etk N-terminal domain-containing protein [Tetrasphaera japonica]CCH78159.1 exported hypothetical protein [Tetrasphaera japonica T1-X7]
MEIKDFLTKRNLLILIGVPVLAGLIAVGVLFAAPTKYTATATVNPLTLVGGSQGQYTGSQAVNQFVSTFQATAQGAAVDQRVYSDAKVKPGDITDNLTVSQVGGSSAVTVTFVSTTKGQPSAAVTAVADETLKQMFGSQVDLAKAAVKSAQEQVVAANTAIKDWGAKNGVVDPEQVYQAKLDRLNSLLQQQSAMKAAGNSTGASALSGTIASVNGELKKYGALIAAYNDLTATRDSAQAALVGAQQNASQAQTQLAAADADGVVSINREKPVDRGSQIVTVVVPVVGAGLFLAVGLILVLELAGTRQTRTRRVVAPADSVVRPGPDESTPVEPVAESLPESVPVRS